MALYLGKAPKNWHRGVIIPLYKKDDRKECTDFLDISLLSFPVKMYAKCLERKCQEVLVSKLKDG